MAYTAAHEPTWDELIPDLPSPPAEEPCEHCGESRIRVEEVEFSEAGERWSMWLCGPCSRLPVDDLTSTDECDRCGRVGVLLAVDAGDDSVGYGETLMVCRTCVDARARR